MRRAFLFQPKDTDKYVSPEILSPEALLLGDHAGRGGLLRHRNYLTGDKRWTQMATSARSTMRLTAYSGPLTYRGHAGGGETGHAGGPSIIRFAPPCNHGADLKAIHAGGVVQHSPPSRSGALGPGFSRPASTPNSYGTSPSRAPSSSRGFYP